MKIIRPTIMLYGLSSLIDGLVMIVTLGHVVSTLRHDCSFWLAKRQAKKRG